MTDRRHALTGLVAVAAAACLCPGSASADIDRRPGWADRIVVYKRKRVLMLMRGGEARRTFRIALGREPRGTKLREGDGRTPEGSYLIDARNGDSQFYRAMHISYPSQADRQRARQMGVRPGGLIMIHGLDPAIKRKWHGDHWMFNWTRGCIAVTNEEMDVIWEAVALGTPIDIHP
ncbi:MAG TPA: L,D-transpeptidase family protein [Geminicoccaceae bacterium]|nr:L,D-transpeptidase family protein [Geminicoccus sp.]HMU49398.1 L,D-transpeptidase family protein [Geminicoccaceae bacterium]